jgi:hypothetical protein
MSLPARPRRSATAWLNNVAWADTLRPARPTAANNSSLETPLDIVPLLWLFSALRSDSIEQQSAGATGNIAGATVQRTDSGHHDSSV